MSTFIFVDWVQILLLPVFLAICSGILEALSSRSNTISIENWFVGFDLWFQSFATNLAYAASTYKDNMVFDSTVTTSRALNGLGVFGLVIAFQFGTMLGIASILRYSNSRVRRFILSNTLGLLTMTITFFLWAAQG